jgi:glycosyltransferase involved in cell wall biosynthesis
MHLIHLTASTFFGGPERQMLGLANALPDGVRTSFISFSESGRCREFLNRVTSEGHGVIPLESDFPRLRTTLWELTDRIRDSRCDLLLTHGYKSNLLGRIAARRVGIPVVSVSRGWTGESWKVHSYEWLDRLHLRLMDRVVCVSEGQAEKVRRCGVSAKRIRVIRNGARLKAFHPKPSPTRERLRTFLPNLHETDRVVLAAGRLSPEKGFHLLVEAAAQLKDLLPVKFLLVGEGSERPRLEGLIRQHQLEEKFVLTGFRDDLDSLLPEVDLVVSSSFTEGLPNVLLEAASACKPIVATRVGGTPEVVEDRLNGLLIPPGSSEALAAGIRHALESRKDLIAWGLAGRRRMEERFSFEAQSREYLQLFTELLGSTLRRMR